LKTADTAAKTGTNTAMLDSIYAQRKKLQAVFNFFDTNGDGVRVTINIRVDVDFTQFDFVLMCLIDVF
jgi:hypothetical protein